MLSFVYCHPDYHISILTEHFAGRWPFWLSPRQVLVIPVMPAVNDYVKEVQAQLREKGFHADIDISGNTMQKKIRTGQLALYNYIFVVGAEERDSKTVNIRGKTSGIHIRIMRHSLIVPSDRDDQASQQRGEVVPLDEALKKLVSLRDERRLENKLL